MYFASRGQRIAETQVAEARRVSQSPNARFVGVERLNLRSGPSTGEPVLEVLVEGTPVFSQRGEGEWARVRTLRGELGWVYASLLRKP